MSDPDRREDLGRRGREYVEREWSYEALAPSYGELHREVWDDNRLLPTLRRKWKDIREGETGYRVGRDLSGSTLGEWTAYSDPHLNMRRILSGIYGQPPLDEEGIPRVRYGGTYVAHPGVVALYALNAFHLQLREPSSDTHLARFATAASWLRDRLTVDDGGVGRWYYDFDAIGRDLKAPWVSCFSQSLGLSIMLRAEQTLSSPEFGDAATAAAQLFRVPVAAGGVLAEEDGRTFLAYPEPEPAHVLNGFVTGMFGLREYYRVRGEPWSSELFQRCVDTLVRTLPAYEVPMGLRYDLKSDTTVSPDYYYFVVQQLHALYELTGVDDFLDLGQEMGTEVVLGQGEGLPPAQSASLVDAGDPRSSQRREPTVRALAIRA